MEPRSNEGYCFLDQLARLLYKGLSCWTLWQILRQYAAVSFVGRKASGHIAYSYQAPFATISRHSSGQVLAVADFNSKSDQGFHSSVSGTFLEPQI